MPPQHCSPGPSVDLNTQQPSVTSCLTSENLQLQLCALTFHVGVAVGVLCQPQSRPAQRPALCHLQEVEDVLVVDLTEGDPDGELGVGFDVQDDSVLGCSTGLRRRGACRQQTF